MVPRELLVDVSHEEDAVAAFEQLGLTEYEARCFVALSRVSQGTASEVSELSDVPRSRVYDTVDRLHERGLVDVQQSDPREYRAIDRAEAFELLRREYRSAIETADAALDHLATDDRSEDEEGLWSIASADHVHDRLDALLGDAEATVDAVVADESTLARSVIESFASTSDRGVDVFVEVPTEDVRDGFEERVADARVAVSEDLQRNRDVEGKRPGLLVLIDEHAVLASGVEEGDLPGVQRETAVWTHGRDHGFAAWARELLEDRGEPAGRSE